MSQQKIAKLLWTKTDDPLRMAVYASLLCRKMAQGCHEGLEKAELIEQADEHETWAMALLEEANINTANLLTIPHPPTPALHLHLHLHLHPYPHPTRRKMTRRRSCWRCR